MRTVDTAILGLDIVWPPNDCVAQDRNTNKWYFYDEAYLTDGPYDTEHECRISLVLYCWVMLENRKFASFLSMEDIYDIQRLPEGL